MDVTQIFRFLFDGAMVAWFFAPLPREAGSRRIHPVLAWLVLLLLLPIYVYSDQGDFSSGILRFVYRTFLYILWIALYKGVSLKRSCYFGLLCWITFTAENNIFLTPQLSPLRWNLIDYGLSPSGNALVSRSFELALEAFLVTLVSRLVPLAQIRTVPQNRWGLALALAGSELYVKYTLKLISRPSSRDYLPELTVYPILMQLLLLTALIAYERYLYHRRLREEERLSDALNRYRYENAISRLHAEEDLRRLHHDLKNHLIVLQGLVSGNRKAEHYIQGLMQSAISYEQLAETGNKLLNGLLSEKIRLAATYQIDVNACFDFRDGSFLDDLDICTIFGNALDNAIEASRRVTDPEKRCILVKCSRAAGRLSITFMNYFEGSLVLKEALPASTKSGPMHGIGLSSIRRSVQKYQGTMTVSEDDYHNFILSIVLPIPPT